MQNAAKVGLLLVVFVALLIGGYAVLGKSLFAKKGDVYYVRLTDAGGINEGTPVLMAGVTIGSVTGIRLLNPKLAMLTLELKHGTVVPNGSTVQLPTSLIGFGETPVNVVPPEVATTVALAPGATLTGGKGSPLDSILPEGRQTVAELNKTMAAFRKILQDQKLQSRVSELLESSNKTIEHFGALANQTTLLLSANQGHINQAITAASAAVENVHAITVQFAKLVQEGKLQKEGFAILDKIKAVSQHADDMVKSLDKLVNDPQLRGPMTKSIANVADITDTGKDIATNVKNITANGTEASKNVVAVSKKAIELTDRAVDLEDKAGKIEDQLKGVLDNVGNFFNKGKVGPAIPKITTEIDLLRESQPGYWRTDLTFSTPLPDSTLYFGLYDALASDKITVELGHPISERLSYRYGIYASTAAVGVDYALAPRLSLRGDLWNINSPDLDLRTSYEFGNGLLGWIGFERILKDNALLFGIGVRK